MWTRAELKQRAKDVLRKNYWYGVVVVLIYIGITVGATVIVRFAGAAATIFLTYPLLVGMYYYFMQSRNADYTKVSNIFYAFDGSRYLKIVGAMAWQLLFLFLWAFVPVMNIIKSIAYSMTGFILVDNPGIGYKRALKLSIAMTDGYKGAIFVFWLSFIGWYLLAGLTAGIGCIFLAPYLNATYAELYVKLRAEAINKRLCTPEELNMYTQQV